MTAHHRVDWPQLCMALEIACEMHNVTLNVAAHEIGISASAVTRMRQGKTLSADNLAALLAWLYPQRIPRWVQEVTDD